MSGHGRTSCVVVALLLAACAGQTRYHHFVPLPRQGWGRQDTVRFHLPGGTSWAGLQASVEVRAPRSFPYSDLWLALEQRDSTARVLHTDTLHMSMADSQGNLLGHGFELLEYRSTLLVRAPVCTCAILCHVRTSPRSPTSGCACHAGEHHTSGFASPLTGLPRAGRKSPAV